MASVFKRTVHGKRSACYYFKFKDRSGRWVTRKGWPSKAKTEEHAKTVEAEHAAVRRGEKAPPSHWSKGHLRPVGETIDDYMAWGRKRGGRGGRGWPEGNADKRERYLKSWADVLGWRTLGDIGREGVEQETDRLLKAGHLAPKSVALKVEAAKAFASWCAGRGLLPANPLAGCGKIDTRPKTPHRPLTADEIARLLEAAPPLRRLWYETALATGYRVGELRALKVRDLDRAAPALVLSGDYTKNRKPARQFISIGLCDRLVALAAGKPDDAPLLGIARSKAPKMFRDDATAAGIAKVTREGKATWHSLRKSFVNAVVQAGADVKTTMELARHSAASMTMDVYASADAQRVHAAADAAAEHLTGSLRGAHMVIRPKGGAGADDVKSSAPRASGKGKVVGASGFEPPASASRTQRSARLSYAPMCDRRREGTVRRGGSQGK